MSDALYIGATGMRAHQTQLDTIANNLANINTVGFRRGLVSFAEVSAAVSAQSAANLNDTTSAASTHGAGSVAQLTQSLLGGELKLTGEPLDVAIDGVGFFEVIRADGTPAYTRAGSLKLNADGLLSSADGSPLAGQIEIPPDARQVRINADGRVTAISAGDAQPMELGQIQLVAFVNPGALQSAGSNLYVATAAAGTPQTGSPTEAGFGSLAQGKLESSGVQMVDELVALMLTQRAFEMNSKVMQAADQMLAITNGLVK